jgi:hypothetical protein
LDITEPVTEPTSSLAPVHPPLDRQAVLDVMDRSEDPLTIRELIVALYRSVRPGEAWRYKDIERLRTADRYRKLIQSMIRSGALVRTGWGSHHIVSHAQLRRWRGETTGETRFTVVALKHDEVDEWIIVACLRDVVMRDDQWTPLPTEENWSRYCGTFEAADGEEAVEEALAAWRAEEDDEDDEDE